MSDFQDEYRKVREDARWGIDRGTRDATWSVLSVFFKFILPVSIVTSVAAYVLWWPSQAATVVQEEFGPRAALEKYSWFKEAAAQLEAKQASVAVLRTRTATMSETYKELPRQNWPREDREQFSLWQTEVTGVTASYNTLAAEYNAKMAEFHWRFANRGDLPAGATEPLPREFKPYAEK